MNPDPTRQWYVYFNDTELGPFTESDLVKKLGTKEFDDTAFVYTDGMANWEAVTGIDILMKPSIRSTLAFTGDASATGTLPVTPSLRLGGKAGSNVGSKVDVDVQFSEPPAGTAEDASRMVDAQFDSADYLEEPNAETSAQAVSPGQFLESQTGEAQGEPSVAVDANDWVSDPVPVSADPVQVETVGGVPENAFDLPPQIEGLDPAASGIANEAPAGEFTEELSGSRAGAFPEDEAHLSQAGSPVASSKTGIDAGRKKSSLMLRFVLFIAVVVVAGILAIQHTPLGKLAEPTLQLLSDIVGVDFVKAMGLKDTSKEAPAPVAGQGPEGTAVSPTDPNQTAVPPATSSTAAQNQDRIWTDLSTYKAADNGAAPAVRLATESLMGNRPILVGVVSPMVMADRKLKKLTVAIFPDGDRSLMVKPRVWIKEVPLFGEYFSIGPLTLDGQPLPAGGYHVIFKGDDTLMGDQVFQIGPWPSEVELAAKMKDLDNQRAIAATEERKGLDDKFNALIGLTTELEKNGREKAIQPGATNRKAWLAFSQSWQKSHQALGENLRPSGDYRFYPTAHASLENYYKSLKRVHGLTELYSNRGAREFQRVSKLKLYTDLLIANNKIRDDVKGELMDLEKQVLAVPKIDAAQIDKIKAVLMGD